MRDTRTAWSVPELRAIQERVAPYLHRTPLLHAGTIGDMLGCELWLKAELLQKTGSYKPRGIMNKLLSLPRDALDRGVITVSAGNAAQALAYAAQRVGCRAVAVMPANASAAKVAATAAYGAQVIQIGTSRDAFEHAQQLVAEHGYAFIPPSDDPDVIAGHASIALEILEDLPDVDLIIVPVGAGGVGAGVATGIAACESAARVVGVEPEGANTMSLSLAAGKPVDLPGPPATIADGLAYPFGGKYTYPVYRDLVERVVLVPDERIIEAMWLIMTRAKLYVEPSGAAGLAGLFAHRESLQPFRKVVCVLTGGNVDPGVLKDLIPPPAHV